MRGEVYILTGSCVVSLNHKSKTIAGLFHYGDSKLVFTGRLMLKYLIVTIKYLPEESKLMPQTI